jgi:hypothetical protein
MFQTGNGNISLFCRPADECAVCCKVKGGTSPGPLLGKVLLRWIMSAMRRLYCSAKTTVWVCCEESIELPSTLGFGRQNEGTIMDLSPTLGPNCSLAGVKRTAYRGSGRMSTASWLAAGCAIKPQLLRSSPADSSQQHIAKLRIPVSPSRPPNRTVFAQAVDATFLCAGTRQAIAQPWDMYG